jgi:hypothetical protein
MRVKIYPFVLCLATATGMAGAASAEPESQRQPADGAWWNGPLLSFPALTIPAGSFAAGTGLYDQISRAGGGPNAVPAPGLNEAEFRPALIYGVSDDFNLGLWPLLGVGALPPGQSEAHVALGDWILEGQWKLRDFQEGKWMPGIALNLAETFPTGRYDRLGPSSHPLGVGAYATAAMLLMQSVFWLPTGRMLRAELNLSYTFSSRVGLSGASVYGTEDGFLGHADPGSSVLGDLTLEYSLSRRWTIATEIQLELDNPTHVVGVDGAAAPLQTSSGLGHVLYVTPYLEYGWSPADSLSLGARLYAAGHNETPTVTPVIIWAHYLG